MNEKLQYRAMLDIPENTSCVYVKPIKKKKAKKKAIKPEDVKQKVIEKVNETTESVVVGTANLPNKNATETTTANTETTVVNEPTAQTGVASIATETSVETPIATENGENVVPVMVEEPNEESTAVVKTPISKKVKKKKRASLIRVQVAIIGVLLGVILLTSVINKNSGLNVFMRNVFAPSGLENVDERLYTDFAPVFSSSVEVVKDENGVITTSQTGSVYALISGEVESVNANEDGSIDVVIKHSENFSSKISGLKFSYLSSGEKVSTVLPLGYAGESGISMCFMGADGEVIKDYTITENSVVWAV